MLEPPPSDETPGTRFRAESGNVSTTALKLIVKAKEGWRYPVPKEAPFSWFLGLSFFLFTGATFLAVLFPPKADLPPMIEVDLGVEGIANEPPPLGEPEAGAGEQQPEPMPEPEMQQPDPAPEEPMVEPPPVPEPTPAFVVPEEKPPQPEPKPEVKPKVSKPVSTAPETESPPVAGSGVVGARVGVRGSPGGVAGGRGGGRGDFISTPHPQYDSTARQRRYEGRGLFLITYQDGRIVGVTTIQSTGVSYLDAKTIAHVRSRFRVKSGVSGSARLPIVWRLN